MNPEETKSPSFSRFKRDISKLPFTKRCELLEFLFKRIKQGPGKNEPRGPSLTETIKGFLNYVQYQRKLAHNTFLAYRRQLGHLQRFCESEDLIYLDEITVPVMQKFLMQLSAKGRSANTMNQNLACVKSLFRYAILSGYISVNTINAVERARQHHHLPVVFNPKDIDRLIEAASQPDSHHRYANSKLYLRDVAMIETLYSTGCRTSELANLRLGDLDFEQGKIRIIECKGRHDRVAFLNESATRAILKYLRKSRPILNKRKTDIVFLSRTGRPLDQRDNRRIIGRLAERIGLPGFHVHSLRHSCATSLLKGGADLRSIQELLGHAALETVKIYTHLNQKDLQRAHKQFHPRP